MDNFLNCTWIFFGLAIVWFIVNLVKIRISIYIAIAGLITYSGLFIMSAIDEDYTIWPLVFMIIIGVFIYLSGKTIPLKTQTAVFNNITNKPITDPIRKTGLATHDPVFERLSVSVDGTPDTAVNMQHMEIEVHETPQIQTATRGIQVIVRGISVMLHLLQDEVSKLLDIAGGIDIVEGRIRNHINQFMQGQLGRIEAEKIDQTKDTIIIDLCKKLKASVNTFCENNKYPFRVPKDEEVVIDDTELDKTYYEALAQEAIASLTQKALNVNAQALVKRLVEAGKELLGDGDYSEAERLQAAQISLNIVKKDINFKKFGVDADTAILLKAIAEILKSK